MKKRLILQHDQTDCGAACLASICRYYSKKIPISRIRYFAGTDSEGTSGMGILKAAKNLGFLAKGAKSSDKESLKDLPFPLIAHIEQEYMDHYVVVYKTSKKHVWLGDPAFGYDKISWTEFRERWSGIFFVMIPDDSFAQTKETKGLFERFLYLLKPHKSLLREVFLASIILTLLGVVGAFYYRFLIDEVLSSGLPEALLVMSIGMLMLIFFQVILEFSRNQLIVNMANKIDAVLILEYFNHVLKLPMEFFSKRKTGEILSRLGDTATIRQAISGTTLTILIDTLMLVIGGMFLFLFSTKLVVVAVLPVILSTILVWVYARPYRKMLKNKAIVDAEKHSTFVESINGIATIKALSTEETAFTKAEKHVVNSIERGLNISFWGNLQSAIQNFLTRGGNLSVFWAGSYFILQGEMSLGELISFNTLLGYFIGPLGRLITIQPKLQEALVASDRLGEILDMPNEDVLHQGKASLGHVRGEIQVKNLFFSYGPRGYTLNDLSMTIPAGQKVAIVGPSGSGKTTLTKLLMKYFPWEKGDIYLDDQHILDVATEDIRNSIGYVPQDILLFSGTIAENIAFGMPQATPQEIIKASIAAQAHGFISKLADRYGTYVGERGATLSGGERQRIALARVILRQPRILILDEATSSLDSITERAIMDTVYSVSRNITTIIVAHRLSTIKSCDKILVIKDGALVEEGDHTFLYDMGGEYKKLWDSQNEFETITKTKTLEYQGAEC